MYYACALGLVDCAGVREHLIPRAREPRPIVNSGEAAGGGVRRDSEEGNRRDFLGQDFFFTVLTLLMKRIARMDLADGFSAASREVQDDSTQLTKFLRFKYFTFRNRK